MSSYLEGYANDVSEIMKALPKICQGFLMSATLSPELKSLKRVVLHSPVVVKLEEQKANDGGQLAQLYLPIPKKDKNLIVYVFLKVRAMHLMLSRELLRSLLSCLTRNFSLAY